MATTNAYIAYYETPTFGDWRIIARVWHSPAHAIPANAPVGAAIAEESKDVARNVQTAVEDWYYNTSTYAVAQFPPADNSAAAQRAEIRGIILDEYRRFDRVRFAHADATTRPIYATIATRTQFLLAALPLNSSDAALDLIKTESRKPLDEFAFYAQVSAWQNAFDGGSFYVFEKGTTENATGLPSVNTGIITPNASQVTAVSLASELA